MAMGGPLELAICTVLPQPLSYTIGLFLVSISPAAPWQNSMGPGLLEGGTKDLGLEGLLKTAEAPHGLPSGERQSCALQALLILYSV